MKFKTYGNRNQFTRVFSRLSLDRYFVIFFLLARMLKVNLVEHKYSCTLIL